MNSFIYHNDIKYYPQTVVDELVENNDELCVEKLDLQKKANEKDARIKELEELLEDSIQCFKDIKLIDFISVTERQMDEIIERYEK